MASYTVEVPKDHPKIEALLAAAKALPDVTFVSLDGVKVTKQQDFVYSAIADFFAALADVVGDNTTKDIVEGLRSRNTLRDAIPDPMSLLADVQSLPFVSALLKTVGSKHE